MLRKAGPLLFLITFTTSLTASVSIPDAPPTLLIREMNAKDDFLHLVGQAGSKGWELDYHRDKPGFALSGLHDPLLLEEGLYRITFELRRGHYPNKGLFHQSFGLFRLELWDTTANEKITERELQIGDFSKPNKYEPRWMEFSMKFRKGHMIEPRVYWIGLGNGEISTIRVERFPAPDLRELENKALRLGDRQEGVYIENGFVVSRKMSGEPDETGDATTYTGFYVASLAWKYAVTKDQFTLQALENGLEALHNAIKGNEEKPIITRYVEEDGTPFSKSPSKDVYTSFFLAYSAAFPQIENKALKEQMRDDVDRIVTRFLSDNLTVKGGRTDIMSLTPYFTEAEVKDGIHKFLSNKKQVRQALKNFKEAKTFLPFTELWPGINLAVRAMQQQDERSLYAQVVPAMNGTAQLVVRVRDLLREQYREDLFPKRVRKMDLPGRRLLDLTTAAIKKLPAPSKTGNRFNQLSDFRVLASNALLSLHIVRTALELTKASQFQEYYRMNLFTQDTLLKTALDWYAIEEDFIKYTAGNNVAGRQRRGYLTSLALYNLIQLETNPETKKQYRELLAREMDAYRHEDNPLIEALNVVCGNKKEAELIYRDLTLYPEDRTGFGKEYWAENGKKVAMEVGGGEDEGSSREPLPVSHRPKDSFLWQRNARRLEGDEVKEYPATDYLFLYWFGRYHNLIEAPPPLSTVKK